MAGCLEVHNIRSGSSLSPLTLEAANALLPPLRSHLRSLWLLARGQH